MSVAVRVFLLMGVAVPFIYFGAQALAAPYFPDFSFWMHTASMLGSDQSSRPYLLNGGAAFAGIAALIASPGLLRELRRRGVGLLVSALVAGSSLSFGLGSLWAASHPLPDPGHSPGALGAGMFAGPFVVLLASFALAGARGLRAYLVLNALLFFTVASLHAGLFPVDLGRNAGAVQRLGAVVMLGPVAVLCLWLLLSAADVPRKVSPQQGSQ